MSDLMNALARMREDLDAAGVASSDAAATLYTYMSALHDRSDAAWRAFYHSVYDRLKELAGRDYPYAGPAALPLLELLDDDLGTTLISAEERERIRTRLVECGRSEASLPS
jgi:hypothetical protein